MILIAIIFISCQGELSSVEHFLHNSSLLEFFLYFFMFFVSIEQILKILSVGHCLSLSLLFGFMSIHLSYIMQNKLLLIFHFDQKGSTFMAVVCSSEMHSKKNIILFDLCCRKRSGSSSSIILYICQGCWNIFCAYLLGIVMYSTA